MLEAAVDAEHLRVRRPGDARLGRGVGSALIDGGAEVVVGPLNLAVGADGERGWVQAGLVPCLLRIDIGGPGVPGDGADAATVREGRDEEDVADDVGAGEGGAVAIVGARCTTLE